MIQKPPKVIPQKKDIVDSVSLIEQNNPKINFDLLQQKNPLLLENDIQLFKILFKNFSETYQTSLKLKNKTIKLSEIKM